MKDLVWRIAEVKVRPEARPAVRMFAISAGDLVMRRSFRSGRRVLTFLD